MKTNVIHSLNRIHPAFWQFIYLTVSIIAFSLVLINPLPSFIRPLSLSLRVDFWPIIPTTAIIIYLLFRIPGRTGELITITTIMCLFAMPLAGIWAYGHTQSAMLGGLIPLNDAQSYYLDAIRLTLGESFSFFSTRRPLFPGFLSVLLVITNNNILVSLAILSAITAISSYYMIKEIQETHGTEFAVFLLMMIFLYYRLHSGVIMSENFGIALGTLGFTILWRGTANKNLGIIWLGIFSTTIALNARAGAFFILPLLVIWVGRLFREFKFISWKAMGIASTAIVLGFVSSILLGRLIGQPSGIPFANFSYTLYSLAAGGKSWAYIGEVHPEVFLLPEPEHTKKVFQLAFELIREKPLQLVQGAFFFWEAIFTDTLYNVFSFASKENWTINPVIKWLLYLLSILGIITWSQDKKTPINSMIMVCALGIFISVPFVPPTDSFGMRPYAASIAMLSALPALGFWSIINKTKLPIFKRANINKPLYSLPIYLAVTLILITLVGPLIIKLFSSQKIIQTSNCSSSPSHVLIQFNQGASVNLVKNVVNFSDWPPNYHIYIFRKNAHSIEDVNLIKWAETTPPSHTILTALDLETNSNVIIVLPSKLLPKFGEYIQLCGYYEKNPFLEKYDIFYVEQTISVLQ